MTPRPLVPAAGSLYTAQDVATFCEVDLKTIHHWVAAGKIVHHRTEGRHLRFRRNDVVRFLRAHHYPLHATLTTAEPRVFLAFDGAEESARKLAARFEVHTFGSAVLALAHLTQGAADAVVLSAADPTWVAGPALAALRSDPRTAWSIFVLVGSAEVDLADALVSDPSKLSVELARRLAIG